MITDEGNRKCRYIKGVRISAYMRCPVANLFRNTQQIPKKCMSSAKIIAIFLHTFVRMRRVVNPQREKERHISCRYLRRNEKK